MKKLTWTPYIQIYPPHLSDVATLPWEIQKSHFQQHYSYTLLIIYVISEENKTETVVLQLQLFTYGCSVLPIICIALVLSLRHTTGGARALIWTCWGLRQRLVVIWAEFQHSVVYYATDQFRKKLEAYFNAEGHSEHLLWHCLSDILVATQHNGFFSELPMTTHNWLFQSLQRLKECNRPSVKWKSFASHKLVWWHFQVGWASGLQFVFFWDNINNQKYVWIILLKMTFLYFPR